MKKIVLCGSKKFIPKFFELEKELKEIGYNVVVPREFIVNMDKKEASLLHFSEIEKEDDQENYIGANGFAELAFGFYKGREIFLLNDIYKPFEEELIAWEVKLLKGDLSKLKEFIKE